MKKAFYIFLASILALTACQPLELPAPVVPVDKADGGKVMVTLQVSLPADEPGTKAMADKPQVERISVAVFGGSGFFNEWVSAIIEPATENSNASFTENLYTLKIPLSMSDSRLRLHFIANGPTSAPLTGNAAKDSEEGMMARLYAEGTTDGYWQKVVLPLGVHAQTEEVFNEATQEWEIRYAVDDSGNYIPTDETVEQFPKPIVLVRNFARIRVQLAEDSNLKEISHFALAYAPTKGSFAPMLGEQVTTNAYGHYLADPDSPYLEDFVPEYHKLTKEQVSAAPYNYAGYFPSDITLGGYGDGLTRPYPNTDGEMTEWAAGKSLFVYERTVPTTARPATRLVVKARHEHDGWKYYRIDLHDAEGVNYPLLRNNTYVVTIGSVAGGTGKDTPQAAATSPTTADISAEITDLPEVSDGIASIKVEYIENTYVEPGTYTLDFQFIPHLEDDNTGDPHNDQVSILIGRGVGNEFVAGGASGNGPVFADASITSTDLGSVKPGWGRITFTTTENTADKFQTIRVIGTKNDGTKIYRDVVIYLKKKQVMTVQCLDKYILEGIGVQERVRIFIPGDLSRSMFPMDFQIEPEAHTLNPDTSNNLPVQSGTSLTGSGVTSFFFNKSLSIEEYNSLPSLPGDSRKYVDCYFVTTEAQSATTVWVHNKYFLDGTTANPGNKDSFYNYTKRYFSDLMFSARVTDGEKVDFSFKMDTDHSGSGQVIPAEVVVKLTGLEPQDGAGQLAPWVGHENEDLYIYHPNGNYSATLKLTAIANNYSIELSTASLDNTLLYEPASRTSADPCPNLTGISITPSSATVAVGGTVDLDANLSGTMTEAFTVTWRSSDESVARVSASGVVTGVAAGPATITATAGGKEAYCTVTVVNEITVEFNLTNANPTLSNNVSVDYYNCDWNNNAVRMGTWNGAVTISVPNGYKLVSVSLTFTANARNLSPSTGTFRRNGNNGQWTPPVANTSTVTLTNTANNSRPRFNKLTVVYEPVN